LERSGITLAVVWRTQVRGTRRRRAVKRGLHIFATLFYVFLETKVASRRSQQQKTHFGTYGFFRQKCVYGKRQRTGLEPEARTRSGGLNNNYSISNNKIQQQQPSYPWATPLPPDKELLSERASSPTSWGEFMMQRVVCSPHTQLSRPVS